MYETVFSMWLYYMLPRKYSNKSLICINYFKELHKYGHDTYVYVTAY